MDYSRKNAYKKQKKLTSKNTMQGKRVGVRLFKAFLLCILGVCVAGVIAGGLLLKNVIDDAPDASAADVKPQKYTSFVYADDGTTVTDSFNSEGSNRIYAELTDIPVNMQHAFVAIEDERFYEHNGIDITGIARAAVVGVTSGDFSEGASTITQQLIKNTIYPNFASEKTFLESFQRKLQEQYLALKIEKEMDKDQILEYYMNTVNLGQNTLGVQTASKRYFNKDVQDLTLSECAVIAAITQNPTGYNPITNPEKNAERREKVLDNMLNQGYINKSDHDEAIADDPYSRIQTVNSSIQADSPNTYFIDALSSQVMEHLQTQLGYTQTQAYNAVYGGGLSIYSTQSMWLQSVCDAHANNESAYPAVEYGLDYALTVTRADGSIENFSTNHIRNFLKSQYGKQYPLVFSSREEAEQAIIEWKATIAQEGDQYDEQYNITLQPQTSITLMDQSTGQIKALVGGRGEKPTSQSLNRAYKGSKRQPGSAFKIITTYAPALDEGLVTLASTERDEAVTLRNGKVLVNAYSGYYGNMTIRKAIIDSTNTIAVKVSDQVTQEVGIQYAEKLGITTLVREKVINNKVYSDLTETLALGGITEGVYNYQICGAYAAIANGGTYNEPTLYTKVLDHDGNILIDGTGETTQAIKDSTAYLLTSAMESVVQEGTGTQYQLGDMPVAGKTGTTTSAVDYWFIGYTPYYTCAVWVGYDDNKPMSYNFIPNIWTSIMEQIHENLEPKEFAVPASVEKTSICSITGKRANPNGSCSGVEEYYATDTLPTEVCSGHYYSRPRSGSSGNSSGYDYDSDDDDTDSGTDNSGDTGGGSTDTPDNGDNGGNEETPTPTPTPEGE